VPVPAELSDPNENEESVIIGTDGNDTLAPRPTLPARDSRPRSSFTA
jgi:hypothetical protein